MAANKKLQEQFLTTQGVGLKGERHGWQRIKKGQPKANRATPGDLVSDALLRQRFNLDFNAAVLRPVLLRRIGHQRLVWACTLGD